MKRGDIPVLEFVAVLAMVLIAITVATLFFPRDKVGDMATWAGAIGAFLAFAGTIWLATRDERRRRVEAIDHARLAAASLLPKLVRVEDDIQVIITHLEIADEHDPQKVQFAEYAKELRSWQSWNSTDLAPLLVLGNGCATVLAAAGERVQMNAYLFERAANTDLKAEELSDAMFGAHKALCETLELIAHGKNECQKAVRAIRPEG